MFLRLVTSLLAIAGPAQAQDQITPGSFLDAAVGHTLTFTGYASNRVVGVEEFLRRDRTVWVTTDGRCTYGTVDIRGPYQCFTYEDEPFKDHFWLTFRHGDRFAVMASNTHELQIVTQISKEPLACEDVPLS